MILQFNLHASKTIDGMIVGQFQDWGLAAPNAIENSCDPEANRTDLTFAALQEIDEKGRQPPFTRF